MAEVERGSRHQLHRSGSATGEPRQFHDAIQIDIATAGLRTAEQRWILPGTFQEQARGD